MSKGKGLLTAAGILTLIATFLLSWFTFNFGTIHGVNGIGGIKNVIGIFTGGTRYYSKYLNLPSWAIYIIAIIIIWLVASGFLQILGRNKPKIGIIGSIIPFIIGLIIMLNAFGFPFLGYFIRVFHVFGDGVPLIEGLIPLHITLTGRTEEIGTYFLLLGGLLGLIGGKVSKPEY